MPKENGHLSGYDTPCILSERFWSERVKIIQNIGTEILQYINIQGFNGISIGVNEMFETSYYNFKI